MSALDRGKTDIAQQATAVPYRQKGGRIEFCLVTSSSGRWIFPKGIIQDSETFAETALIEAQEEAGLHGEIIEEPLGFYEIEKDGQGFTVIAVLMRVSKSDKDWKESDWRQRRWLSPSKARQTIDEAVLGEFIDAAVRMIEAKNGRPD